MLYEILGEEGDAEKQLRLGANISKGGNGGWAHQMLTRFYYYTSQFEKGDAVMLEAVTLALT